MSLLVASQVAMGEPLGYLMLLLATASLGIGFGFTVPSLNSYAAAFFPAMVGKATLYLNALLGLGTALAPLLSALFLGRGVWWALPVIAGALLLGLLLVSLRLPLAGAAATCRRPPSRGRRHAAPAAGPLLGVRRLRAAVRHRGDGQRQLVDGLHVVGPGRLGGDRLAGPRRVLGHGHRRPGAVRGHRAAVPGDQHVPAAAVRGGRGAVHHGAHPHRTGGAGRARRSGWPGSVVRHCCR